MKRRILLFKYLLPLFCIGMASCSEQPATPTYDLVIYGGTSSGIVAAIQATKMGKTAIVIEPSATIGGLSTGGLGATDIGNKQAIGGISREFYERIAQKYANPKAWKFEKREAYIKNDTATSMWTFEPKVAKEVFADMVKEYNIDVVYNERLDLSKNANKENGKIISIEMESGNKYYGKIFIDATYEGDLLAKSNISYTIGREPNSKYNETLSGVQTALGYYHQFPDGVDPYIVKGDANSGLLPNVNAAIAKDGTGDDKVQAFCFRMCITDVPENQILVDKPKDYKELEYELLFRAIEAGYKGPFFIMSMMPNRKTDSNNKGPFSTDYIGKNYDYPDGDYKTREAIVKAHEVYQKGLLWTLGNHPRVPAEIREEYIKWGLPKDEYTTNGHWTPQLYIREARRMVSDFVMTEHHCTQDSISADQSIGMGAYTMDSHHTQRYIDQNGFVKNEGDVEVGGFPPYPISYKAIVPNEKECTNLLVPVCLSASHMAFGSIRMEPVFMILGQSAATAACIAIDQDIAVQKVPYPELKKQLKKDKQVL
ncbi:FAD-dependent oxidoreductase [Cellulophaga sp. F20128]|uniref:FAD-dependent oxidoreductase n=1 Tax=Cellulophaga sp. F20128 TaxID=2926413 RepID=UPI001FF34F1E|nr:FAD-dependent oxidoreductase [Cellulophaga sp. F20128]MCK0155838.1 FAD-dependent oxidoreductase [Cellulophaga sp. F20128]